MASNNKLILNSGKEYTLAQLFNGDNKIIIPDLQRDYCWGDKAWDKGAKEHTELVSGFINNLIEIYYEENNETKKKYTLGLIYGYEIPLHSIQLCDGQQRITTLFLLLGMLNRKVSNDFEPFLVTEEEKVDDNEPNLLYAIRESTLYFLSDLVCYYFRCPNNDDIRNQEWYFNEYDQDASIQSMLAAIDIIDKVLNSKTDIIKDYKQFGDFILNNILLLYYDMGERTRGEETFVIINTTGEPLTATENLKPILIGNIQDEKERKLRSEEWEKREDWFWQNRTSSSKTSDGGMKDFFIWYWQIALLQEKSWKGKTASSLNPLNLFTKCPKNTPEDEEKSEIDQQDWFKWKSLERVHSYFYALVNLLKQCDKSKNVKTVLNTIEPKLIDLAYLRKLELIVVLPLIAYLEKFPDANLFYQFVRKIRKNYYDYKWAKSQRSRFVDWRHIIQIIDFCKCEEEVLKFNTYENRSIFKNINGVELGDWYTIIDQYRNEYAMEGNEIEKWEDHPSLMGDISILIKAAGVADNYHPEFRRLEQCWETYKLMEDCFDEKKAKEYPNLSNYVRLRKTLYEEHQIGHIPNTSGMTGAWFSYNNNDDIKYSYISTPEFILLCSIPPEEELIVLKIKEQIKKIFDRFLIGVQWNENLEMKPFTALYHLKSWLFAKVLIAEEDKILLSYNSASVLASYNNEDENLLIKELPFSLGNSICGYAKKAGRGGSSCIDYASDSWWNKPVCLDNTLITISFQMFKDRREQPIPKEYISKTDENIKMLVLKFISKLKSKENSD